MKLLGSYLSIVVFLMSGCDSAEVREKNRVKHLASLTCSSPKEGKSKEELTAIADACFKRGGYTKSSGQKW